MNKRLHTLIILSILLITGCTQIDTGFNKLGYQKIDEANRKIASIQDETSSRISDIQKQNDIETRKFIDALNA